MANPPSVTLTRTVEWIDTDASGHYHNSFIARLEEACERELMTRLGVADDYFASAPRVHASYDYLAPLAFRQEATATLTIAKVGGASLTFGLDVWGEAFEGRPRTRVARGTVVAAHVAPDEASATPWPDAMRAALSPVD